MQHPIKPAPVAPLALLARVAVVALCLGLAACNDAADSSRGTAAATAGSTGNATAQDPAGLPEGLFLGTRPEGQARKVSQIREAAAAGDEVVLEGFVAFPSQSGANARPFVDGAAILTLVDATVHNRCTQDNDHCTTPWDYCCTIAEARPETATIQVLGADGRPLARSLRGEGGLTELSRVTVVGNVRSVDPGHLIVAAKGLYVHGG